MSSRAEPKRQRTGHGKIKPVPEDAMLDARAQKLLKTLIERYIAEGQPVGSRVLSRHSGLELSPRNAQKVAGATTRKVVVGARHSAIRLHRSPVPGSVQAKAYTVEPTGDVTFVQAFLSGAIVNVSVPPTIAVAPDEPIWLEFDQERMHLFDGETEMALMAN